MEKLEFKKDKEEYSSSKGRYLKYFFEKPEQGLFQIGETDDYFYFTIMLKDGYLRNNYSLTIEENDFLYDSMCEFLEGYTNIEVMEEGSTERKSIGFIKNKESIEIVFNLTEEEKAFYTIELANLRRLGDTRFSKLVPSKNLTEKETHEAEFSFRYEFKGRIHKLLDQLEKELEIKNHAIQKG